MSLLLGLFTVLLVTEYHLVSSITVSQSGGDLAKDGSYICGSGAELICKIKDSTIGSINYVEWSKCTSSNKCKDVKQKQLFGTDQDIELNLNIYSTGLYSCHYDISLEGLYGFNFTVTEIKNSVHGCTSTTSVPTPSTSVTTPTTTSDSSSTITAHFPGLNPLVYTVVSAFLLGILVLVSIITCWVRSRKNARYRALLPQETPQDYLDYIQQGQFTPLTTSEFVASLRERPPTYNESEVIQQRLGTDNDSSSPPLPPPNPSSRASPIEEEEGGDQREQSGDQREPLGNLDTSEGLVDHPPIPPLDPTQPNLFPDDFTLSFLLDESNSLQQTLPPLIMKDESGDDDLHSLETTNLLVGVIPSINNAVV